jgi:hypothetical protein
MTNIELAGGSVSNPEESLSKKRKGDSFSDLASPLGTSSGESLETDAYPGDGLQPISTLQPPPRFNLATGPSAGPASVPQGDPMDISDAFGSLSISGHNKVLEPEPWTAMRKSDDRQVIVGLAQTLRRALEVIEFFIGERSAGNVDVAQAGSDKLIALKEQCNEVRKECDGLELEYSRP